MKELEVEIEKVVPEGEFYKVVLSLQIGKDRYSITIPNLVRRPSMVRHEYRENYLVIKLIDDSGEGIGSCCIHEDHIDRGCLECETLVSRPC